MTISSSFADMVKPAKSKGVKLSLGEFLGAVPGAGSQSWADDEPEGKCVVVLV